MKQKTAEMLIELMKAPNSVMRLKGRASLHILIHLANNNGESLLKDIYALPFWTNKTLRQHILYLQDDRMIELLDDPNDGRAKIARLTSRSQCKLRKYEEKFFDVLKNYV